MRKSSLVQIIFLLLPIALHAQENKKPTPAFYFEKGELALAKKEYFRAQAHYNECLRLDPYFAEAYRSRGIAREHLGEHAKALTDYNVYVDLRPQDAEALFSRAVLRFDAKQYLLARQDFLKLITLPTGETNTVYFSQEKYSDANGKVFTAQGTGKDYLYNYLGLIETKLSRYNVAIAWLDSAINLAPGNASYWINRGATKLEKKDKEGAAADFEQALKVDPGNSLALHNLGTLKAAAGESESSEKLLSESIEKNKGLPYPRAERAYQRFMKNDLTGALEDYDEVVRLEPKDEENFINRGLVKEKMNDLKGALDDFSKAIELNDVNGRAWLSRGNIMSKQSRWKEAVEDYTVAINIDPEYALAFYNRAIAHHNSGKTKEACADLKAAEQHGIKPNAKVKEKFCKGT